MMADFKDQFSSQAEKEVFECFPKKVVELDEMLRGDMFSMSRMSSISVILNIPVPEPTITNSHEPNLTKKRKVEENDIGDFVQGSRVLALPTGSVPCNAQIQEMVDQLKPSICTLIDKCNLIKMWVQLMIPKIEDGNNFGVSVQEDALSEIRQVEGEAASYLDQISRYYLTRGKIISKVAKYPHVQDYRQSVMELDEKEFISLRLVLLELRNHYTSLYDLISKNLDKIKKPRGTNTDSMY
ncbi:proteasome activator complex subunit 3-like isoform X2 [Saccoglossus kowalevskii]|uniref:Proteasome activator complex subunit 3-like isoform X2 n=1 Tax=Saccoglossus kowalevskii TaxID=10224 RepID=A0ABM0M227_SACKO|nr:PREDICTED: proteasome activator complex subunit 3-like isoform X2 [Saccoglossus kowalevskii]